MKSKYNSFYFHKFEILLKENKIIFSYSFDKKIYFNPEIELDLKTVKNKESIELAVFNLGMAMLVSYYKAYCPKKIIIEAGCLNTEQIKFWHKLYENGLMQFFYENKIDFKNLINIQSNSQKKYKHPVLSKGKKVLLPIGGGKDSLVSAEILKEKNIDFTWFYIQQHEELNNRITTFLQHFVKIGDNLEKACDSYNKSVGSVEKNIRPTLNKFNKLGVPANKAAVTSNEIDINLKSLSDQ